jgi:hypothetical protein
VEQNLKNNQNEFLWTLQRLVDDFPQSGVLQALFAHASDDKNLRQASVYFNPRSLFKLVNAPSAFKGVPNERIFIQAGLESSEIYRSEDTRLFSETLNEYNGEGVESDTDELQADRNAPVIESESGPVHHVYEPQIEHNNDFHVDALPTKEQPLIETESPKEETLAIENPEEHAVSAIQEPPVAEAEIAEPVHHEEDEAVAKNEPANEVEAVQPLSQIDEEVATGHEVFAEPFIDEVKSEALFSGINEETVPEHKGFPEPVVHETQPAQPVSQIQDTIDDEMDRPIAIINSVQKDEHQGIVPEIHPKESVYAESKIKVSDDIDETFDEIVGIEDINFNSRSTGDKYFSFDQEFGAHDDDLNGNNQAFAAGTKVPAPGETDQQNVSKYHDEKMPYTFMWWLDKTRKEHAKVYQPYVKPPEPVENKKSKKITDELQQQYFENIFHITSVEELDKTPAPQPAPYAEKRKEQVIMERFIKEEPQIKPQSSDKLDNENKAKKSSEDRDELVTETLASIYSDQMLYHKAIASYRKLMLKFPEKSRYFADKIEQLEKKTN